MNSKKTGKFYLLPLLLALAILQFCNVNLNAQGKQTFTISGRVTASDLETPVGASLIIYSETNLNGIDYIQTDKAITDEHGNYSIQLKSGLKYKLQVYAWDNAYLPAFYNNAVTLSDATVIELNSDIANINFALAKKPVLNNGFHGVVKNSQGTGVAAKVTAVPVTNGSMSYSASTDMNTGIFSFENITPGEYVISVTPEVLGLSGGFFKENDIATSVRSLATVITVDESGINAEDYLVILADVDPVATFYGVSGIAINEKSMPLSGVDISVVDASGNQVGTAITDSKGMFEIGIESIGKFQVTAAKEGYDNGYSGFALDANNPSQMVKLVLTKHETVVYNNGIKGIVKSSDNEMLWARIIAYKATADGKNGLYYSAVKTAYTSKENPGEFSFSNMEPGNYVLFAEPNSFAAGYYNANGLAVNQTDQATMITVNEEGINSEDYVILLEAVPANPVTFDISGMVVTNDNQALSGVKITVTDEKGGQSFTDGEILTNEDGMFKLSVTEGFYTITASKEGYVDNSVVANTYDKNATLLKTRIVLDANPDNGTQLVSDVNDGAVQSSSSLVTYPNPANENLNVSIPGISGIFEVSVLDINGNTALNQSFNSAVGSPVTFNVSGLQAGTYIVRVKSSGSESVIGKFIKQ